MSPKTTRNLRLTSLLFRNHSNSELDLSTAEDKTDYDPIEEEEDRFNAEDQLSELKPEFKASNHLLKQRSDSSTRRKLIRQKATTNEYYSQQQPYKQPSKLRNFCHILRTSLISSILMFVLLGLLMIIIFEVDSDFLEKHRQSNELIILREQLYDPIKSLIYSYFSSFKQSASVDGE